MKEKKIYSVTEVLESFGRFHLIYYLLAAVPSLVVNMINMNFLFVASDMDYRCRVPECDTLNSTHLPPNWWPNEDVDKCSKPVISPHFYHHNETCSKSSFSNFTESCTEWIYESNNTVVAELNLACQPWKMNLIGTIHNVGMLFSMIIAGWMTDRFGRKPTMIFCATSAAIGHLKPFAINYYMYVAIEFFEAFFSGGVYVASSVMLIEFSSKSNRVFVGVLVAFMVYFGECVLAVVAMAFPYWKTLIRIIYTPPIFFLAYIFLIKESPRWQILNGKIEEAKSTIKYIARINKKAINESEFENLDEAKLKSMFNINCDAAREGYKDVFTSREILKRLMIASICRFTNGLVYYGLAVNSVLLPGNKYVNFLLSTVTSFPGELLALYFMNKVGRKIPLIFGFLISGCCCVASGYTSAHWARLTFFCLGKMLIAACFTGVITYTMELYPTSVRALLLGFGAFTSRLGIMLAPLTPMLLLISPVLPSVCFGGAALASSILLTAMPETKDSPLPDTIGQVNAAAKLLKDKKINQTTKQIVH